MGVGVDGYAIDGIVRNTNAKIAVIMGPYGLETVEAGR